MSAYNRESPFGRILLNTYNVISNEVRNLITSIKTIDFSSLTPRNDRKDAVLQQSVWIRHRGCIQKQNDFKKNLLLFLINIVFFIIPFKTNAQLSDWEVGGYVKNLSTYTDGTFEGLSVDVGKYQNTLQGRLNIGWYPADNMSATVQSRHLLVYQDNLKLYSKFLDLFNSDSYYFDMNITWIDEQDVRATTEFDRAYLDWTYNDLQITLGRQRMAWGACLVWNPTDLFNPFNILDFDYEERPGTDALHLQYYTGPISQFNLAITPGRTQEQVIYAFRYLTNFWNYDFSFIAGWQKQTLRLGGSWVGDMVGGGFRGEFVYSKPDIKYSIPFYLSNKKITSSYWTLALSYDYTFANSLYIHTEYLYNGLGTTTNAALHRLEMLYTGELTPARQSTFLELAYDLTPLLRGDIFMIYNPDDNSWITAPSLTYSFATNWEMYLLVFPSGGDPLTEFGGFPTQYFARIRFSF